LALVGGVAVKKLGLLALASAVVLKFAKIIILGALGVWAAIMKFFRRKPRNDTPPRSDATPSSDAAGGTP
jgi:uncharacterized membrane-anchored protein